MKHLWQHCVTYWIFAFCITLVAAVDLLLRRCRFCGCLPVLLPNLILMCICFGLPRHRSAHDLEPKTSLQHKTLSPSFGFFHLRQTCWESRCFLGLPHLRSSGLGTALSAFLGTSPIFASRCEISGNGLVLIRWSGERPGILEPLRQ